LSGSDRPIATFLQWVTSYPRSHPSASFIR
jgi:hypothetical protein